MTPPAEPASSRRVSVRVGETSTVRPGDILVQPIDVEVFRSGVPPDVRIRGHFANQFAAHVEEVCPEVYPEFLKLHPERVPPLRSIPLRDLLLWACDAARLVHPELPLAEAIRRLGWSAYGTVLSSLLGKMLFASIGKDPELIYRFVPRAYTYVGGGARVTYTSLGERHFRYDYAHVFTWLDCYQVGAVEGVAAMCGCRTEIRVHLVTPYSGSLECRWFRAEGSPGPRGE